MDAPVFEEMLSELCQRLTSEAQQGATYERASDFEDRVRLELASMPQLEAVSVDFSPHPHQFPDIILGTYGIEVKFTNGDSWRSVANSVFESTRNPSVTNIYVVYGKLGGQPEVKWEKYEDCVIHVRTSHVPRFEMRTAAARLEPALFKEYWGCVVAPEQRICKWLELADGYARDWIPSKELFGA